MADGLLTDPGLPRAVLERALDPPPPPPALRAVSIPVPRLPIERLFALRPDETAVLWAPPTGVRCVGFGRAAAASAAGTARFSRLAAAAAPDSIEVQAWSGPGTLPASVKWFAAGAFDGGTLATADAAWAPFPASLCLLPRWRYEEHGAQASLTLVFGVHSQNERARFLAELDAMLALAAPDPAAAPPPVPASSIEHGRPAGWRELVAAHLCAIRSGEIDKVVAARRSVVTFARALAAGDLAAVLQRLGTSQPNCTRFALRLADATFLGATPERLVELQAHSLRTEALAGSRPVPPVPPGEAGEAASLRAQQELVGSHKERAEHALVVAEIRRRLEPLCSQLDVPASPSVKTLRHILHLHTPIAAELRAGKHVLDVVAALHPTPAVAGTPTAAALARIAASEPDPRGYYAGPFGWFDADGNGEFVVALRSAVCRGNRAFVYAGAGLVAGSDPDAEYAETALKQRAVLEALGAPLEGAS